MGIGAKRVCSKNIYTSILPWRKMETHVTYKKWQNFDWFDFVERDNLAVTFMNRHLPLSDGGDHFQGRLKDPELWTAGSPAPAASPKIKKTKRSSRAAGKKKNPKVKVEPTVHRRFDSETGRLVSIPVDST